ncbi:DUF3558 family protein [Corynebacterium axilliensis]|uniref:DUF3558 family protein n=1 Tax=Corynebacterium sp. YSMAA5_1_F9 TaxID=3383591 RepID=UPI0038CFAE4A
MKRIGGLVLGAVACTGVLASCALPGGLGARVHGGESGGLHDFADGQSGGGSADSGVADVTATTVEESDAAADDADTGRGVLPPLGTFDRTVPGFRVFDPCSEIPSEVLAELGLEPNSEPERESGYRSCHFDAVSASGEPADVALVSQQHTLDAIRETYPDEFVDETSSADVVYTVEDTFIRNVSCTSYVETSRGLFSVSWTQLGIDMSMKEKCIESKKLMNSLI